MALQLKEKFKLNFAISTEQGLMRRINTDSFGKFPFEQIDLSCPKGQLFIVADSKSGNPKGQDPGKMGIRIIQKNYFAYPSADIEFCLQRAFDTANRYLYQYAQANNLHRKIGATCSALALTDKYAYVAHVGDCRIYQISVRKIERLTHDHTRIIEMMPRSGQPQPLKRPVLTRALGVTLGVKIDSIHKIPIHRDEYFVLCSDGLKYLTPEEIQYIVLSSSPDQACKKLVAAAKQRGSQDDITVQVIKVYNQYVEEDSEESFASINDFAPQLNNWPVYFMLSMLIGIIGLLLYEPLIERASGMFDSNIGKYSLVSSAEFESLSPEELLFRHLLEARQQFDLQNWNESLKIYKTVLRNYKNHPEALQGVNAIAKAYKQKGAQKYHQKNWKTALNNFRISFNLNKNDPELITLINQCKKQIRRIKNKSGDQFTKGPATITPRVLSVSKSLYAEKIIRGIYQSQWITTGLDERDDFIFEQSGLIFYENIRIKKAINPIVYDGVEAEVKIKVFSGGRRGKYGIIFAYNAARYNRNQSFFLFTLDNSGQYILQQVRGNESKVLLKEDIRPGVMNSYEKIQLKVKYFGKLVLLYANGELLKMVPVEDPRSGSIGLYADPKLRVEFRDLTISPAIYKRN